MNFNKLPGFSSSYALSSLKNSGCKYMVRMTKFNELLILLLKENILPLWVTTIHPLSQGLFRLHNKTKKPQNHSFRYLHKQFYFQKFWVFPTEFTHVPKYMDWAQGLQPLWRTQENDHLFNQDILKTFHLFCWKSKLWKCVHCEYWALWKNCLYSKFYLIYVSLDQCFFVLCVKFKK